MTSIFLSHNRELLSPFKSLENQRYIYCGYKSICESAKFCNNCKNRCG